VNQHTYVENCQRLYLVNGLQPGNPDDGVWEEAHYPAPKGKGDDVILLLHEHHQVHGLLQSEEYGKCCFFSGDAKKFLTTGPFVSGWFELWDLYDKWKGENARINNVKLHSERNTEGKSLFSLYANSVLHSQRDELGRSLHGLKWNEEKDQFGRSVTAVNASAHVHDEKLEDGRSKYAVEVCGLNLKAKYRCLHTGFVSSASGIARRQRRLGYESGPDFRVKVTT